MEVTNVLLYNRPFTDDDCKQLKATKNNKLVKDTQNNKDDNSYNTKSNEKITEKLDNNQEENNELLEKSTLLNKIAESTSLQTRESAISVKIYVSVGIGLLFLLFGVDVCVGF